MIGLILHRIKSCEATCNNRRVHLSGQAMPFFLIMIVVLVICWAMMLNIAKLLTDRMMMQNAADNAAISVAVCKARLLNKLGAINLLIACQLYGTEEGLTNYSTFGFTLPVILYGFCTQVGPADIELIKDTQQRVGSIADVPAAHGGYCTGIDYGYHTSSKCIDILKGLVHTGIMVQNALIKEFQIRAEFIANSIANKQELNSRGEYAGADYAAIVNPNCFLLQELKRNMNGVGYCETDTLCISIPPNPFLPDGAHIHTFWTKPETPTDDSGSWLYGDSETFSANQKITVMAVKNGSSSSNKGYPVFAKWLGIQWPTITTYASARVYNRSGPMFPLENGRPSDSISAVIKAYRHAQNGGWDAQLVPCDFMEIQH